MFVVQRYHDFSYGHRVSGHENACARLHGHNGRMTFTCAAAPVAIDGVLNQNGLNVLSQVQELDKLGRVIDFSVIKSTLCQWLEHNWDHRFLCWEQDNEMMLLSNYLPHGSAPANTFDHSIVWLPFNPTAENMAEHMVNVVGPLVLMGTGVQLVSCKMEETRKCSAVYAKVF